MNKDINEGIREQILYETQARENEQRNNRLLLEGLHKCWLSLIPWEVSTLKAVEVPFEINGRTFPEKQYCQRLVSATRTILQRAANETTAATAERQREILAELLAAAKERAYIAHYWDGREADGYIPGEPMEKEVVRLVSEWIADNIRYLEDMENIRYLEDMEVKPRRKGDPVTPQPAEEEEERPQNYKAEVYALAYIIDKIAAGETIPEKTKMKRDIERNYKQFARNSETIYKNKNKILQRGVTPAVCAEIAGQDWKNVIVRLSNRPNEVEKYLKMRSL